MRGAESDRAEKVQGSRAIDSHQPYSGGASARDRASEKKKWERINGIEGKKKRVVLLISPAANTRESNRCVPAFKLDDPDERLRENLRGSK